MTDPWFINAIKIICDTVLLHVHLKFSFNIIDLNLWGITCIFWLLYPRMLIVSSCSFVLLMLWNIIHPAKFMPIVITLIDYKGELQHLAFVQYSFDHKEHSIDLQRHGNAKHKASAFREWNLAQCKWLRIKCCKTSAQLRFSKQ